MLRLWRWGGGGREARTLARWGMALWLWAAVFAAQAADKLVAGPEGTPMALADAVKLAQDGDTIELLPGDYVGGLVLENRRLTLRGMGGKAVIKGDGKAGAARALWMVRGGDITIENVEFREFRAADGGGSGVRHEGGKLTIRQCQFFDNEYGLSTGNDGQAEITIERSIFGLAPKVVGGLYHLLNVGRIGKLHVTGSRFQQGFEGHLIKSRARENFIGYNFVHDGLRGGASYEIEIAAGGLATIIGNVIAQGSESQNPVVVAYGTEGKTWDQNVLILSHNTLVNYGWMPAWFLRAFVDRLPEGTEVFAVNNLIVGPGVFWWGAPGQYSGNRPALKGMLRDIDTYSFELQPDSIWRGSGVDSTKVGGRDMSPKAEFQWPLGTVEIKPGRTSWAPGAYQR